MLLHHCQRWHNYELNAHAIAAFKSNVNSTVNSAIGIHYSGTWFAKYCYLKVFAKVCYNHPTITRKLLSTNGNLIYKKCYENRKTFLWWDSLAKCMIVRSLLYFISPQFLCSHMIHSVFVKIPNKVPYNLIQSIYLLTFKPLLLRRH